jgi:CRP/FNR family transcriptional regulator
MSASVAYQDSSNAEQAGPRIGQLEAIGTTVSVDRRQTLFFEGDEARSFYRVLRGTIAGYKMTPDGRRQVVEFFYPGDLIGFAHGDCYSYSAEAIDDATVCAMPRAQLQRLFRQTPDVQGGLISLLNRELAAAQDRMLLLGRKTAKERLATFLIDVAGRYATDEADEQQRIPLPMNQSDIADYLGLRSETVSREFAELKKDGAIEIPKPFDSVLICDRDYLEIAAEEC